MCKKAFLFGIFLFISVGFVFAASKKTKYEEMSIDSFKSQNLTELYNAKRRNFIISDYYYGILNNQDFSIVDVKIPDWKIRAKKYLWEKDINRCIAKGTIIKQSKGIDTYYYFQIEDFENLRTVEEVEANRQIMLNRIAVVKELSAKKIEEIKQSANEKGALLAKGYTYHGYDEIERNEKLFKNKALEKGHAYYIPSFTYQAGFAIYKEWINLFEEKSYSVFVTFLNQTIKAEYVDLGKTDFIIIGGNVIIGNIGEVVNSSIDHFQIALKMDIDSKFEISNWNSTYEDIVSFEKELGIEVEN